MSRLHVNIFFSKSLHQLSAKAQNHFHTSLKITQPQENSVPSNLGSNQQQNYITCPAFPNFIFISQFMNSVVFLQVIHSLILLYQTKKMPLKNQRNKFLTYLLRNKSTFSTSALHIQVPHSNFKLLL